MDEITQLATAHALYAHIHSTLKKSRTLDHKKKLLRNESIKMVEACLSALAAEIKVRQDNEQESANA